MRPLHEELPPLLSTHTAFMRWERAKHRANVYAKASFPQSHPLRQILKQTATTLENHRWSAEITVFALAEKYGSFRAQVQGSVLNDPAEWFRPGEIKYFDDSMFDKSSRRNKQLFLIGVHSMFEIETSGKCFVKAVHELVGRVRPKAQKHLLRTAKVFEKDCKRLEHHLKRVRVCQQDRFNVLLCLRRRHLPHELAQSVLEYLV